MRRRIVPVSLLGLALALCACGTGGSSPAASTGVATVAPSPPAIATPTEEGTSAAPSVTAPASPAPPASTETAMPPFTLTSSAFDAGGSIPRRFTCDGADVSPVLVWNGAPSGTAALVLVVDDPDARGWAHWLVLDLPGAANGSLPEGVSPSATDPAQGTNDFGRRGWGGPCPPSGSHRYAFTLYAIDAPLGLRGAPDAAAVRKALRGATILGTAVLEGTYRRGG